MGMIDFQGLLNVVRCAENEPNLFMGAWVCDNECGTSHCMIGSFCHQTKRDELALEGRIVRNKRTRNLWDLAIADRFGISLAEVHFLFTCWHLPPGKQRVKDASCLTKPEALARLRKFIYYKMHKNEMTLDEARRISGNNAVVRAKEEVCA